VLITAVPLVKGDAGSVGPGAGRAVRLAGGGEGPVEVEISAMSSPLAVDPLADKPG